jgi:hypothetical protein
LARSSDTGASLLTVVVLLGPTFLMGGTLPVAARAVETDDDSARRRVGLLYGANALGAVVGCVLANFLMLEVLGTRSTLWATSAFNLLIAGVAWALAPAAATAVVVVKSEATSPSATAPEATNIAAETASVGAIAMTAEPPADPTAETARIVPVRAVETPKVAVATAADHAPMAADGEGVIPSAHARRPTRRHRRRPLPTLKARPAPRPRGKRP